VADKQEKIVIKTNSKFGVSLRRVSLVLLAAALAGSAVAESRGAKGRDNALPFKGSSSGLNIADSFDPVAGIAYGHIDGEGEATHLGHFTVHGDVGVVVATGIPHGTWTLTAANGDQLFLDMTGRGIDDHHGLGQFTVTGGTGRFEGASGYYEQIITFEFPLGTADVMGYTDMFEGTITLATGH
jgi:hypothetical protein